MDQRYMANSEEGIQGKRRKERRLDRNGRKRVRGKKDVAWGFGDPSLKKIQRIQLGS